jgi:hypothetical protein
MCIRVIGGGFVKALQALQTIKALLGLIIRGHLIRPMRLGGLAGLVGLRGLGGLVRLGGLGGLVGLRGLCVVKPY